MNSPLDLIDQLMGLRARSWRLSKKEDNLISEIHSTILYRSAVDKEIDKLEEQLLEIRKHGEPEPKGAWGWMK